MALAPERRQVSLIGGDLPQARLADNTPNLSGIQRLAGAFIGSGEKARREKDARQAIIDELEGEKRGSSDSTAFVGKDENGRDVPVALPQGSPSYLRGWLKGFDHVQDGKFRTAMEARFNEIQSQVVAGTLKPEDATQLMQDFVAGASEFAPGHRRGYYAELGAAEIAQRSGLMTIQDANEKAKNVATDLGVSIKDSVNRAVSHAAAGGDPAPFIAEIETAYQSLVDMGRIGPKEAELGIKNARQLITGQGLVSRLTGALARGEVSPDELDRFGTAIETNDATAETVVNRKYQVGPFARSSVPEGYRSKDVFLKIEDEDVRKDMGLKLRMAAQDYKTRIAAYAQSQEFTGELALLASDRGRGMSLSSKFHDDADALMGKVLVEADPFRNPESARQVFQHLSQTKYMPKPLAEALSNMARMSDPKMVDTAVQFYRTVKTLRNNNGDAVGETLRASMPEETVRLLEAMDEGLKLGFSAQQIVQNIETARGNDEFALGPLITRYNDATSSTYKGDMLAQWTSSYGGVMDPEAQDAFDFAYRQNFIVLRDPEKAFAKAWEMTASRYRKSDIMLNGVETGTATLANPAGYEPKGVTGLFGAGVEAAQYEWVNDTIRQDILDTKDLVPLTGEDGEPVDVASLVGTPSEMQPGLWSWLTTPYEKRGGDAFLGRTVKLVPVPGSNPDAPEYTAEMFSPDGHHLGPLMVRQGEGVRKMIFNPHLEKQQFEAKSLALTSLEAAEKAGRQKLELMESKLFLDLTPEQQQGWTGDVPMIQYIEKVQPGLMGEYNLERSQFEEGLKAAQKAYEEQTGETLPPSKVGPQSLLQPKAAGVHVAAAAAATIDAVLPDGTGGDFLMRLTATESNFGKAKGSFRVSGDKGITQVNTGSGFKEVKRRVAMGKGRVWAAAQRLKQELGIDIASITAADLDKPLVSMAVARLYVEAVGKPVPQDVEGQARWWKRHYNTYLGAGKPEYFVKAARKVPDNWRDGWQVMPTAGEP